MYHLHNHRHRKPDFLLTILLVVGIALLATLALHVRALDHQPQTTVGVGVSQRM
jgi:hypothetical protein